MESIWQLTVEKTTGQCVTIFGDHESLNNAVADWAQYESSSAEEAAETEKMGGNYCDVEAFRVRCIHGVANDATRLPVIMAYRYQEVCGMVLAQVC